METEPTAAQMKAIKALERAFAKCCKENVHFHNHYGRLVAYNGDVVALVNDTKSEISCTKGYDISIKENLNSWADDVHYIHIKEVNARTVK